MSYTRTIVLTSLAMIAFASNSLLCRVALRQTNIDAASFTTIRLISGALMLWLIVQMRHGTGSGGGNWLSAFIFTSAASYSFAYVRLAFASVAILGGIAMVIVPSKGSGTTNSISRRSTRKVI